MAANAFSRSSRWGVPGALAGMLLVSSVQACFGLSESAYNKDDGTKLGASGNAGTAGTSTVAGSGGSATAGSPGSSGSVSNGGSLGNAGNNGDAGSVANGGSGGGPGNGGSGGAGGGQSGAGGQAGAPPVCPAKPTDGTGTGLKGDYFATKDLSGAVGLTRTDPKVDFDWAMGSPGGTIPVDGFSVRWTGQVQPRYTGTYTFTTRSDDGSRVMVDGKTVVDAFVDQSGNTDNTGTADLMANQKYPITVEYYENAGGAVVHMWWESSCQALEIVPTTQLYPQ